MNNNNNNINPINPNFQNPTPVSMKQAYRTASPFIPNNMIPCIPITGLSYNQSFQNPQRFQYSICPQIQNIPPPLPPPLPPPIPSRPFSPPVIIQPPTIFTPPSKKESDTPIPSINFDSDYSSEDLEFPESRETEKKSIIQNHIQDDLATHDFTESHISREEIQNLVGFKVKNISWYQRSLVHKSIHKAVKNYEGDGVIQDYLRQHNERMEYLGDSVLGLIVANYLFTKYPDKDEGFMTKLRTKLVNGTMLANLGRKIQLGKCILMSNHVNNIGGRDSDKILEDAFEALIAAVFKDLGFDYANEFVTRLINELNFNDLMLESNFKDVLLRYSQKECIPQPDYQLLGTEGPPHNRIFTIGVHINDEIKGTATAKSKKKAEQIAAKKTLNMLKVSY